MTQSIKPSTVTVRHLADPPGPAFSELSRRDNRIADPARPHPGTADPNRAHHTVANRGRHILRLLRRWATRPTVVTPGSIVDGRPLLASDPVAVDGYRLLSRLGAGGTADVYLAAAPDRRLVAVKVLRGGDTPLSTCRREFQLASTVDPICTAPVVDHGLSPAGAYLVTAYLTGYRCGTALVGRALPTARLWALGSALARALATIHAHGVVHCDVKPSNLLVLGGDVRMIDFGIARYVGERFAPDGIVQCTRGWAAPEQLRCALATPAVDVFAWGCVLAHLASGVHPFASRSDEEWILRIQSAEPDLFAIESGLAEVIRSALARDAADRPTARELVISCLAASRAIALDSAGRGDQVDPCYSPPR